MRAPTTRLEVRQRRCHDSLDSVLRGRLKLMGKRVSKGLETSQIRPETEPRGECLRLQEGFCPSVYLQGVFPVPTTVTAREMNLSPSQWLR